MRRRVVLATASVIGLAGLGACDPLSGLTGGDGGTNRTGSDGSSGVPTDMDDGGDAGDEGGPSGPPDAATRPQCAHDPSGFSCACDGGPCTPQRLFTSETLYALTADDAALYVSGKSTTRIPLSNPADATPMAATATAVTSNFVQDATQLYYYDGFGLAGIQKTPPFTVLSIAGDYPFSVTMQTGEPACAIIGGYIFAAGRYIDGMGDPASHVYKASKDTRTAPLVALDQVNDGESVVTTDGTSLFLLDRSSGTIRRYQLGATFAILDVAKDQKNPRALVVDATNLYWVNADDGTIMQATKTGFGATVQLADMQGSPTSLTSDGSSLFWTTADEVRTCPLASCKENIKTLAKMQAGAAFVNVTTSALFWAAGGGVMRLGWSN
jgi:hypothetical protein